MPKYDLINEPWLPVIRMDSGKLDEVGLREALCRAHEFRAIQDPLPTVEFGLYRLLIVLILDIFRPKNRTALCRLLESRTFEPTKIDAYFDAWKERFDLFSRDYPFLQTAIMDDIKEEQPIRNLIHTMFTGQSGRHFHHYRDQFAVSPAVAARMLTTISPFALNGGRGYSAGLSDPAPWYVLIDGRSLFASLCLNTYVLPMSEEMGIPAWRDTSIVTNERRSSTTFLEAMTWRARRVLLIQDTGGRCSISNVTCDVLVRQMRLAGGFMIAEHMKKQRWRDPNAAYKLTAEGMTALYPEEGKSVWRDTAPLALLSSKDYGREDNRVRFECPYIVDQLQGLHEDFPEHKKLLLTIYGLRIRKGQAKVFEWYHEQLFLPKELVLQGKFHLEAQREMENAEAIARILRGAVKKAKNRIEFDRNGKIKEADSKIWISLADNAEQQYWQDLRSSYDSFLEELANISPTDDEIVLFKRNLWRTNLVSTARRTLRLAIDDLDTYGDALARQAIALNQFEVSLAKILPSSSSA